MCKNDKGVREIFAVSKWGKNGKIVQYIIYVRIIAPFVLLPERLKSMFFLKKISNGGVA